MEFEFSAGAVIYSYRNDARRYLFLKRKEGWLDLPKGHIEKEEHAEDAAVRETREETGLDIRLVPFFKKKDEYWFAENGGKVRKTNTFFIAEEIPEKEAVKVSFEHVGYEWLTKEEANKRLKFKDQKELIDSADSYINKKESIDELNGKYGKLPTSTNEWNLSHRFVPGEGNLDAKVMFIGQAPGRYEDEQLRPFIGRAGELLTKLIKRAGLNRDDVYITSVVQFFPPKNRLPTSDEAELCIPFLTRQLDIVKPQVVVLLGNFAAKSVIDGGEVMKNHGKLLKIDRYDCDFFVTLHPAAAVRLKKHLPTIENDFEELKRLLKNNP
ncbi:MAG: NUDIX domain-containing protein [Candidatus Marsarchaeota archaeon]|nr:NUDIX domain-containing protein [Candidatus Marsarchaeota archaeon]